MTQNFGVRPYFAKINFGIRAYLNKRSFEKPKIEVIARKNTGVFRRNITNISEIFS